MGRKGMNFRHLTAFEFLNLEQLEEHWGSLQIEVQWLVGNSWQLSNFRTLAKWSR
jgi:hypothetical protein